MSPSSMKNDAVMARPNEYPEADCAAPVEEMRLRSHRVIARRSGRPSATADPHFSAGLPDSNEALSASIVVVRSRMANRRKIGAPQR